MYKERVERALSALSPTASVFRLAIAGVLAPSSERADTEVRPQTLPELGLSAGGELPRPARERRTRERDPREQGVRKRIKEILAEMLQAEDEGLVVIVPKGGDLMAEVERAQARIGRVFGAAQVLAQLRQGTYDPEAHAPLLESYPWRLWNQAERQIAPPLVIEVEGRECHPSALAERLDGAQKFVLVLRGEMSPPAPLARLITPGVFVQQTSSVVELERLARVRGPAIAALVPAGAARFVHDPAGGATLKERLTVSHLDTPEIAAEMGGVSPFRMSEDLEHLRLLATLAAGDEALVAARGTERLSAPKESKGGEGLERWLLDQAVRGVPKEGK